jgi:PKD repeat protein
MNEKTKTQTWSWRSAGLRACSLAVAGLAVGLVQVPGVAQAATGVAPTTIKDPAPTSWRAGEPGVLETSIDFGEGDAPLTVTLDWGDGQVSKATYAGYTVRNADVTLSPGYELLGYGETLADVDATHTYGQPGSYPVSLTVVDAQGDRTQLSYTAAVAGVAMPVAAGEAPAAQLIHYTDIAGGTYGQSFYVYATGGGSGNPVTFSSLTPDVCTTTGVNGMKVSLVKVGWCTVAADQAGSADYAAARGIGDTFVVGKAPLTVKADNGAKTSGAADPAFTVSVQGLVNGDTASVVQSLQVSGPAVDASPGVYPLRVTSATADNYAITTKNGALTINPVVRLASHGLPDGVPVRSVLRVDSGLVAAPFSGVWAYGSTHQFRFAPIIVGPTNGDFYVTTRRPFSGPAVADIDVTAQYYTIPDLIGSAVDWDVVDPDGTDIRLRDRMGQEWRDIQVQLGVRPQALNALKTFATRVQLAAGDWLTTDGAALVLQHLQVVYTQFGGSGTI